MSKNFGRLARAGNLKSLAVSNEIQSSLARYLVKFMQNDVFSKADIPHEILDIFFLVDELWAEKRGGGEICKISWPGDTCSAPPQNIFSPAAFRTWTFRPISRPTPHSVFNLFRNYANFFFHLTKKKNLFWKEFVGEGKRFRVFGTEMSTNWWNFFRWEKKNKISCRRRRPSGRPERCWGLSSIEWKTNMFLLVFFFF